MERQAAEREVRAAFEMLTKARGTRKELEATEAHLEAIARLEEVEAEQRWQQAA